MAKTKKVYFCRECGGESAKWFGRCTWCDAWDSCVEQSVPGGSKARSSNSASTAMSNTQPTPVAEIAPMSVERIDLQSIEVNRLLGGGLVPGSLVLLGGEPGIGKSTLALQIALKLVGQKVLYVSGEESTAQIKLRADRVGIHNEDCLIYSQTNLEQIILAATEHTPDIMVIDSIQTLSSENVDGLAGNLSQIRECTSGLLKYAKESGTPVILIGHITKDGSIAGPKILEHIVDVVLQFEGDSNSIYRILRSHKNRFGSTNELGVFEMNEHGLREVENPSEILLTHYEEPLSGVAIGASLDGNRVFLIESQALVTTSAYGTPARSSTGFDHKRMGMIAAVLEKRLGFRLGTKDLFVNIAGGIKVTDTGLDLALVGAIISSALDIPLGEKICFAGEVGLSGEVRAAQKTQQRISEAERLGFESIVVSSYAQKSITGKCSIKVIYVSRVAELAQKVFAIND